MPLSYDLAALISFACESVLWGANATLFITALVTIKWHNRRFRDPIIYLNLLVFCCCTAHFALHFYIALNANDANKITLIFTANYLLHLTDFLGDLIFIYRCWRVWNKSYFVALPPLLIAVGALASATAITILQFGINPTPAFTSLIRAYHSLAFFTHASVTFLIAWRIESYFSSTSHLRLGFNEPIRRSIMLVIESGVIYLFQLVFLWLDDAGNNAEVIIADMAAQIYGIAPTLIVIRVGLGISFEGVTTIPRGPVVMSMHIKWLIGQDREAHRDVNWDPEVSPSQTESHEVTKEVTSLHPLG